MSTPTQTEIDSLRMQQLIEVNTSPVPEGAMTTDQMREQYEALGFMAPYVVVRRKSDGKKGTLEFTHNPRWYFNFVEST